MYYHTTLLFNIMSLSMNQEWMLLIYQLRTCDLSLSSRYLSYVHFNVSMTHKHVPSQWSGCWAGICVLFHWCWIHSLDVIKVFLFFWDWNRSTWHEVFTIHTFWESDYITYAIRTTQQGHKSVNTWNEVRILMRKIISN